MSARLSTVNEAAASLEPGGDPTSPLSAGLAGSSAVGSSQARALAAPAFGGNDRDGEDAIALSAMAVRALRPHAGWSTASRIARDAEDGSADRLGDYARSH